MAIIRHYVKPQHIESIIKDGVIKLERCNTPEQQQANHYAFFGYSCNISNQQAEFDKIISDAKGDQVWFTEQSHCNTSYKAFKTIWKDCYIEFDSNDIPVQKWHYFKKDLLKNKPESEQIVRGLDKTAKMIGDNPYDYWVSEVPIDITLAKRTGIFADNFFANNPQESLRKLEVA